MKTSTDVSQLVSTGKWQHEGELTPAMRRWLAQKDGNSLLYDLVLDFTRAFPDAEGQPMSGTVAGRLIGRWVVETC